MVNPGLRFRVPMEFTVISPHSGPSSCGTLTKTDGDVSAGVLHLRAGVWR
jgi:hypothetical protein